MEEGKKVRVALAWQSKRGPQEKEKAITYQGFPQTINGVNYPAKPAKIIGPNIHGQYLLHADADEYDQQAYSMELFAKRKELISIKPELYGTPCPSLVNAEDLGISPEEQLKAKDARIEELQKQYAEIQKQLLANSSKK